MKQSISQARLGKDSPTSAQDFLFSDANGGSSPGGCRAKIDVSDSPDSSDSDDNVGVSGRL